MIINLDLDPALSALGEQLDAAGERAGLVVIGGAALVALRLVDRPTRDVDVLALGEPHRLGDARPLPAALVESANRVADDFGLEGDWLNSKPADLLDFGLPEGFSSRLTRRDYGPALTIWYASRLDQIHFKLYAVADLGAGRHEADLRSLEPTRDELISAAEWARTHDPSAGFRDMLLRALAAFGVDDADLGA
jgi:hypothetical protein